MPNLYNKLMAKDMPGAEPAPTSRQMVQAPMGLRSAMKRYAEGGDVPQGMTPPPPEDPRRREEPRPDPGYPRPEYPDRAQRPDDVGMPAQRPADVGMPSDIYPVPRMGGITLEDGTFIPGVDNGQGGVDIGGPAFFAQYANNPEIMARLREMYGFTGEAPEYRQPQTGYTPEENVPPMENPGYELLEPKYEPRYEPMYEPKYEPMYEIYPQDQDPRIDPRMRMLKEAISGQGVGSLMDSQKIASLLQSLGYSK